MLRRAQARHLISTMDDSASFAPLMDAVKLRISTLYSLSRYDSASR